MLSSSMSTEYSPRWIDLESCPSLNPNSYFIVPTGINKDNFIVLEISEYEKTIEYIHIYNTNTNKWTTTQINISICATKPFYPAFDANRNILYFLYKNYLMQMELNDQKITKHLLSSENNHNSNSQCVIVNNELFVIGGDNCYSISKWNAETNKLIQINTIYNNTHLYVFGLTFNNKKNYMLLFGGYDKNNNHACVDYILKYDATQNELNKLPTSLPKAMCDVFCLNAINNKNVLIFGGYETSDSDDIYVYSIKMQTIKKSKIKCPTNHYFSGIIVNDKSKDEKT
eukprot:279354_1